MEVKGFNSANWLKTVVKKKVQFRQKPGSQHQGIPTFETPDSFLHTIPTVQSP